MTDQLPYATCACASLADLAIVPMGGDGLDERVFVTIDRVLWCGEKLWWLNLSRCHTCEQHWMIAQEERIYDVHFMKRIDTATVRAIVDGYWPEDFPTYERVLALGRKTTRPPIFLNRFAFSLQASVEDLREERADITSREIAHLLGISQLDAWLMFWKVKLLGTGRLLG